MGKVKKQMSDHVTLLRDRILKATLPYIQKSGWSWRAVEHAIADCKIQDHIGKSIFPNGIVDVVAHFSDWADREMFKKLEHAPLGSMRSKDKVRAAVLARYKVLTPYKEEVKAALAFWALPNHVMQGQRVLWRSADRIWNWAGDTATDYTKQTKRMTLSSIIMATCMVWIDDQSSENLVTETFLDRRLENVMEFGKAIGTMKRVVPNLFRQAQRNR